MRIWIIALTVLNVLFLMMHELDACHQGEWKMFGILNRLSERTKYLTYLYLHIPLTLICLLYLYVALNATHKEFWIVMNLLSVFHLVIHLIARRWKSNVFESVHSFFFIVGAAMAGALNLALLSGY